MSDKHKFTAVWSTEISFCFRSLVALVSGILIIAATLYMSKERRHPLAAYHEQKQKSDDSLSSCNLFSGKWVYDNKSDPLYSEINCSFMDDGMACNKYGRKNLSYQYWRWQLHDCDLPSATFKEHNATVDFYWSPLLVESNCDDLSYHRVSDRIIRVQAIEKHAKHRSNANVLVFNSYIWWRWLKLKILWGPFESEDGIYEDVEMLRAYEMALKTLSDWVDNHVNHIRTEVFFVSMSPTHDRAEECGMPKGQNCYNETEPILNEGHWGMDSDPRMMGLVEAAIAKLSARGFKIHTLNITQLSEYRKEAHSSIYRKHWDPLTKKQLLNPSSYADCMHWCLPGVPDVWNMLLYAKLFCPLPR